METKILDLINESNSIVLLTHVNPDGDAIGSVFSMYYWLTNINKAVDIVIPEFPPLFNYFDDINRIVDKSNKNYDLAIVVDCSTINRIGQKDDAKVKYNKMINIDHHISNMNYGDINYVYGDEPACCQILYNLFKKLKVKIDRRISKALMTGLLTDTCGFRNNDVNKDTFLMAADLSDKTNIYDLYYEVLSKKNIAQFKLTRLVMDRIELFDNGRIAFSYIYDKDIKAFNGRVGDHEGLVDIGRNIEGVEISIFVREENNFYHISLRSNGKSDVNNIAKVLGGGGHKMAAGAKITGNLEDIESLLINEAIKELNR